MANPASLLTHPFIESSVEASSVPEKSSIQRNWRAFYAGIAVVADLFTIYICRLSAYGLTYPERFSLQTVLSNFEHFGGYCLLTYFSVAVVNGLYRSCYRSTLKRQLRIATTSYVYASLIYIGIIFLLRLHLDSRAFVLLFLIILPVAFAIERLFLHKFNAAMQRRGYGVMNTLIVGISKSALEVFERFKDFPELGYKIKGFISSDGRSGLTDIEFYELENLPVIVKQQNIECILLPMESINRDGYSDLEKLCRAKKIRLQILSPEAEALLEKINVHDIAGITLYAPSDERNHKIRKDLKRAFDLFGGFIGITLHAPIFLLIAIAIKLESGGPIFFRQWRALADGSKRFVFYKFRTMIEDAENQKNHLYRYNESNGALFKIKDDPRLTKVGRVLRRWSLDELPQLFNVLKGEMSLVGPRPLPIEDLERLAAEDSLGGLYTRRAEAVPGVTGLWQVSGRSHLGFTEMVILDLYYIENQSFILDLEILFGTIPVVLFGKGAY